MLILFACLYPNRRIDILALFIPVSFKPKHVAWAFVGLALVGFIFFELWTSAQPFGGFAAESAGAITLFAASSLGVPVSTTHTITGAIIGVGAIRRASAVSSARAART